MRHFPIHELGYAIGFVVLLAALYVGAYYAMVERVRLVTDTDPPRILATSARYWIVDSWAQDFYAPLYALDRQLRPGFWHAPDPSSE
jgi:hypothetical protein